MSGLWVIAVGGPAAFAHAAAIGKSFRMYARSATVIALTGCSTTQCNNAGAAMVSTCWGPAVGARVMTYRTAALLGAVFQTVGALGFGRSTTQPFGEVLGDWTVLQPHPQTTVYTLMWIIITSAICQWLAVWRCVLVPSNLALGESQTSCTSECTSYVLGYGQGGCQVQPHSRFALAHKQVLLFISLICCQHASLCFCPCSVPCVVACSCAHKQVLL